MTDSLKNTSEANAVARRVTDGKSKPDNTEGPLTPIARKVIDVLTDLREKDGSTINAKLIRVHLIPGETTFFHEELKKQLEEKHGVDEGLANATSRVCIMYYCALHYRDILVEVHEHGPVSANKRFLVLESIEPAIDIVAL